MGVFLFFLTTAQNNKFVNIFVDFPCCHAIFSYEKNNNKTYKMKIANVHIHNFRSIQDASISFQNYSVIVGENNIGKSNIIDAIRCFYGDVRFETDDFCKRCNRNDSDAWIDVTYDLTRTEYATLAKKYQVEPNKLRVRKDLSGGGTFHGYTKDGLETTSFYGTRSLKPSNLGNIIYIPTIVDVKENLKLSGTSALNGLVSLVCSQPQFRQQFKTKFETAFESLGRTTISNFKRLGREIRRDVNVSGVRINIGPRKISSEEMLRFLLNISVEDGVGRLDLSQIGTGVQRKIIASLIKLNAQYAVREQKQLKRATKKNTGDAIVATPSQPENSRFSPRMNVLLFEEPEVALHPSAISDLVQDLHDFADTSYNQLIATTHSSQLVSADVTDLNGLIRVDKRDGRTNVYQNTIPDAQLQMAKNMVYFDRPRSDMFFAKKVVLVEGPTEYMLYNYLKNRGDLPRDITSRVTLIESVGKWSMPYFLKVLKTYNIRHSVLFDMDSNPNRQDNQDVINEFSNLTEYHYGFQKDIETFCGIKKSGNPAINIINKFEDGTVAPATQAAVVQIFKDLITRTK